MSRSKLLLLTLGISSAIHLVLAAGFLLLDKTASTPSAYTVVEISLQQPALATTTPPRQPREKTLDERVLSSQRDTDRQHLIADTDTQPTRRAAEALEPETETESTSQTTQAQHSEDTLDDTLTESPSSAEPITDPSPVSSQAVRAGQQNAVHSSTLETQKQNYLGLVAEHINSYKYYPRSAIRRGTEGQVEVSFDLQPDGSIENLRTQGEHSILLSASQHSIEQALPMPKRSRELLALGSIHIEFSMKYFLHEQ